jgi:phosphoglycerate transport regulatory protein PgtC
MQRPVIHRRTILAGGSALGLLTGTRSGQAQTPLEPRVVIVTSFSRDVTTPFVQASSGKRAAARPI